MDFYQVIEMLINGIYLILGIFAIKAIINVVI